MSQALFTKQDVDLLGSHIEKITKEAQKQQMLLIEPHEDEIRKVTAVILDFVAENKRKIYGGYALNLLVRDKNPKDAIYTEDEMPDIDFYSPEPLRDLVKICNTLHQMGFKRVMGREALHKETYSIKVNNQLYCDISYVPRNIYHRMPFRELAIKGQDGKVRKLMVIGPEFMMIDYFRLTTDMILSAWRLEKSVKRFYLLQKYYPLPHINAPLPISGPKDPAVATTLTQLLDTIHNFVQERPSTVVVGFYAYDHFLKESGILKANRKIFRYVDVPYYEIITTEYKQDGIALVDSLKKGFATLADDLHVVENYPFFQFWGYSAHIYYKDFLLAKVFSNNNRCIPFITVPSDNFRSGQLVPGTKTISIGSFSQVMLYGLISVIKARVDQDKVMKDVYYTMLSHLIDARNYYFSTTKKTIYDTSPFQEFVIKCKGVPVTPEQERQMLIEYRKKRNRKYIFSYDPATDFREEITFVFANSSGNPIKNFKNLKLVPGAKEDELEPEESEE